MFGARFLRRSVRRPFVFYSLAWVAAAGLVIVLQSPLLQGAALVGLLAVTLCLFRQAARTIEDQAVELEANERQFETLVRSANERLRFQRRVEHTQKLESMGLLAGGIAHDFNNLLVGVLGNAELLRKRMPAGTRSLTHLEGIESAALRAADLTRQMLTYTGRTRRSSERIDVNRMIREMKRLLETSLTNGALLTFRPSDPAVVEGDPSQLRQLVMNLISNAAEALEGEGAVLLTTRQLELGEDELAELSFPSDARAGLYVALEVQDNGTGMDAETLANVFDPFFTTKTSGRGLGLAVVQGIVRSHGGAMHVESEQGKGSRLHVYLPACTVGALTSAPAPFVDHDGWRGEGLALVVDDEALVRRVVGQVLASVGLSVETAGDGEEGLEVFREKPAAFDLVILDLTMPRRGGIETLREMRRLREDVQVILISGFVVDLEDWSSEELRRTRFIHKPFRTKELISAVREIVEGSRLSSPTA